jgi:tetratricopeptide (TPR) repeat protein
MSLLSHTSNAALQSGERRAADLSAARNSPCPCGSGRRFKSCCGAICEATDHLSASAVNALRNRALELQCAGDLVGAIESYDRVLRMQPDDFDAAHMRAVALYQLGCANESCAAFFEILSHEHPLTEAFFHNFGLAFAATVQWSDDASLLEHWQRYRVWQQQRSSRASHVQAEMAPRVSVVLACYNHAPYVQEAIASVLQQTVKPHELIIIDDGSVDGSAAQIAHALEGCPLPVTFIARENRGAAASFNEAIALASGEWILPINSDDRFALDRIAALHSALTNRDVDWGFGGVDYMDYQGERLRFERDSRPFGLRATANTPHMAVTTGLCFLLANPSISTGNLFFRKSLWERLSGFADWRYHHDWDFALRASCYSEPLQVTSARYDYRVHDSNTIAEQRERVETECKAMMRNALALLCDFKPAEKDNPFAPCPAVWHSGFFGTISGVGWLELLPHAALSAFVAEMRVKLSL